MVVLTVNPQDHNVVVHAEGRRTMTDNFTTENDIIGFLRGHYGDSYDHRKNPAWKIFTCEYKQFHAYKKKGGLWYIPMHEPTGELSGAGRLLAHMARNGIPHVKWHCAKECGYVSPAIHFGELRAREIDPYKVEVFDAPSRHPRKEIVCAVTSCERADVEFHHWAPGSRFPGDYFSDDDESSDMWPGDYLCRRHHVIWHERMNGYRWGEASPVYHDFV